MILRYFLYNFVLKHIYFIRHGVDCLKVSQAINNS